MTTACLAPNGMNVYRGTAPATRLLVGTAKGVALFERAPGADWHLAGMTLEGLHISSMAIEPVHGGVFAGVHRLDRHRADVQPLEHHAAEAPLGAGRALEQGDALGRADQEPRRGRRAAIDVHAVGRETDCRHARSPVVVFAADHAVARELADRVRRIAEPAQKSTPYPGQDAARTAFARPKGSRARPWEN